MNNNNQNSPRTSTRNAVRLRPSATTTTETRTSLRIALSIAIAAIAIGLLVLWSSPHSRRTRITTTTTTTTIEHSGDHDNLPKPVGPLGNGFVSSVTQDDDQCTCNKAAAAPAADSSAISSSFAAAMGLNGTISDCCCSFTDLERANLNTIYPLLRQTVATPFFAHFKIDLISECPLWKDQPLCMLRDCSVCEVDEPPLWAVQVDWMPKTVYNADDCDDNDDYYNTEDRIVTTVDLHVRNDWSAAPTSFFDLPIRPDDVASFLTRPTAASATATAGDEAVDAAVVVDLRLNPERYTGYGGASAARVWSAVHMDNCFQPPHDSSNDNDELSSSYCSLPSEQRVYNRVISGMHSSISLHIAHSYCLEMDPHRSGECRKWGLNQEIGQDRLLRHRDRIENLYVAFALLLRAVQKAGPAIAAAVPRQDDFYADSISEWTDHVWPELSRLAHSCPVAFDETNLLTSTNARPQLLRRFRHLQRIMQCVGCDRCKLWGTLQTLGIGTALRILLQDDDLSSPLILSRQEAVALVHTLERFSSALVFADELLKQDK